MTLEERYAATLGIVIEAERMVRRRSVQRALPIVWEAFQLLQTHGCFASHDVHGDGDKIAPLYPDLFRSEDPWLYVSLVSYEDCQTADDPQERRILQGLFDRHSSGSYCPSLHTIFLNSSIPETERYMGFTLLHEAVHALEAVAEQRCLTVAPARSAQEEVKKEVTMTEMEISLCMCLSADYAQTVRKLAAKLAGTWRRHYFTSSRFEYQHRRELQCADLMFGRVHDSILQKNRQQEVLVQVHFLAIDILVRRGQVTKSEAQRIKSRFWERKVTRGAAVLAERATAQWYRP